MGRERSLVLTPKSFADKSHQFILAKLNILQVRNIWRSGLEGPRMVGVRGGTQYWTPGGEGRWAWSQGEITGGPEWGSEAGWNSMGIVGSPDARKVTRRDLRE